MVDIVDEQTVTAVLEVIADPGYGHVQPPVSGCGWLVVWDGSFWLLGAGHAGVVRTRFARTGKRSGRRTGYMEGLASVAIQAHDQAGTRTSGRRASGPPGSAAFRVAAANCLRTRR